MIQTLGSEAVRVQWGKWLDSAYSKVDVVITRFGRPAVVMINYDKWNELQEASKKLRLMEALQRARANYAEMLANPSSVVTEEQYQQMLKEAGLDA